MAKNQEVGQFVQPATSMADIVVSGLGFEPTGIIIRAGLGTSKSIGCGKPADQGVIKDTVTAGARDAFSSSGEIFKVAAHVGKVKSFDEDGFTIEIIQADDFDDIYCLYYAFRSD